MHDKLVYDNSTLCYICNEEIGKDKVRDHFHVSGKFRGAAHEVCNLKYMVPQFFLSCVSQFVWLCEPLFIKTLENSERDIS